MEGILIFIIGALTVVLITSLIVNRHEDGDEVEDENDEWKELIETAKQNYGKKRRR